MAETSPRSEQRSPLQTDRGTTTINDAVVAASPRRWFRRSGEPNRRSAGATIPGDTSPTMGELFNRVSGSGRGARGVSAEVGETQAAVDLTISVPYGRLIPEVVKSMRENVIQRFENLTGLDVTEVNITVRDVFFPEQQG